MILRFPYLEERLQGFPPPTLPRQALVRWRPLLPITMHGPAGLSLSFARALMDPGAELPVEDLVGAVLSVGRRRFVRLSAPGE